MTTGGAGAGPRIAYVCEGGGAIGWGHVGRGRALLEEAAPGSALVLGRGHDEIAAWCRASGVALPLRPWRAASDPLEVDGAPFDALVVDHYTLDAAWIAAAAESLPVYVVDDWMRSEIRATGLIGPNLGAVPGDWPGAEVGEWLVGARYSLQRAEIRARAGSAPAPGRLRRIVVTLGGSDPGGCTAMLAEALAATPWYAAGGSLTVVLGASYAGPTPWDGWPADRSARLAVVRQPADFVDRCATADLVVCGASTTTYEMACLGAPFLPVALVDNQARITRAWADAGVGTGIAVWDGGWTEAVAEGVARAADPAERVRTRKIAAGRVDGRGGARILAAIGAACATAGGVR